MPVDLTKSQDFAERYAMAWSSKDPTRLAAFYSAEGSLTVNGGPPVIGRNAIIEVAHSFMTSFPDMHVVLDDLRVQGDRVELHWLWTGTNTGPGGTGHRVRITGFELWTISADGLIASSQGHFDATEYHRQHVHGID